MICGDSELSALDARMVRAYKATLAGSPDPAVLRDDQRRWRNDERNSCRDIACLKRSYNERLTELKTSTSYTQSRTGDRGGYNSRNPVTFPGTVTAKPVSDRMVKNARMAVNLGDGGSDIIAFHNGSYEAGNGPGDPETMASGIVKTAFGDLNGDTVADAVVIVSTNTGGSGIFYSLCALMASPTGQPISSNSFFLGDRTVIRSLRINSGRILLNIVTQGPNDGMCCPTKKKTLVYRFINGRLMEVRN
jgi:hypothetical protein